MKLVSVAEMQAIEREANGAGLTYDRMMEHAGTGTAELIVEKFGHLVDRSALGLIGSGNNGGDTLVALASLAKEGWKSSAYLVRPRLEDDPLIERLRKAGGQVQSVEQDPDLVVLSKWVEQHAVILDGVLGTGIKLPLHRKVTDVLTKTGQVLSASPERARVVAVDCPSGVDCDSGKVDSHCLAADLTVTMAAVKDGLMKFPANDYVGELRIASIGIEDDDASLPSWQAVRRQVADSQLIRRNLPARPRTAHKGTFGTAMIAAGSVNFTGAALLAGKAAYRIGAGLVTLAVPEPLHAVLAGGFPEATWLLLPDETGVIAAGAAEVLLKNLDRATALLIGPGLGLEETTRHFMARLFDAGASSRLPTIGFVKPEIVVRLPGIKIPPLVIDADGLKLLARLPDWPHALPGPAILTPHPGEMSILSGMPIADLQADRVGAAEKFAREWGHVIVLKGANTVVAGPDGDTSVIPVATPALARAGTGDVLAGLITGLRAQGVSAYPAAVTGAWIHAQCGLKAAQVLGTSASVLASDLLDQIAPILCELSS
jgi:ADP-dependent NAD(P)H-hydrate dehydratase / NAD(P)H-hydrate epimerase